MNPLLPEVTAVQHDGPDQVQLSLHIPEALAHFSGHFPGMPVLPGVVQVDWAVRYGRQHLPLIGEFAALENLKFHALVLPQTDLQLLLSWNTAKTTLSFNYSIGESGGRTYSSGRVAFKEKT
jgi:3-hydroxyacyl-[acyl-carrier-protein] dehydratase